MHMEVYTVSAPKNKLDFFLPDCLFRLNSTITGSTLAGLSLKNRRSYKE